MLKFKKLISTVLALAIIATSIFVGTVAANVEPLVSIVNTYDDDNVSYNSVIEDGETRSYIIVDGVEKEWYCFATWNASVQQDSTKTGSVQNAVQFVKAAKLSYKWPAAVRIYDNNSSSVPHFKAKPNTTYEIKVKYMAVTAPDKEILLQVRNTNTSNMHETGVNDATKVVASQIVSIKEATNGWVETTAQFTTGDTVGYLNLTLCSATETDAKNVNVWIDDVTLKECRTLTAYSYDGSNKTFTVTADTKLSDISLPTREGFELEGIYSNSIYTNKLSASDIIGNYSSIYYNWVKVSTKSLYCGFENYTEQIEGYSLDNTVASIVEGNSYNGAKSLKLVLANKGITAFELRDSEHFDIVKGKEYTVTFAYKSTSNAKISVGMALAGNVTKSAEALVSTDVSASNDWQTATVVLTADKSSLDGYALAMLVYADTAAEIYIDDIKIKYAGEGSASLDELDFGFTGDTFPTLNVFNKDANDVPEEDEDEEPEDTTPVIWDGSVAESFAGGSGTQAEPYLISNGAELALAITQSGTTTVTNAETGEDETVNEQYYGSYYIITKDIYLNEVDAIDWKNATEKNSTLKPWYDYTENFSGNINGNGHIVYGLYHYTAGDIASSINYSKYGKKGAGLIPLVEDSDTLTITNMGIDCSYVRHQYSAGAFVGSGSTVTITNCFVGENVKVEGKDIGAFIGRNYAKKFTLQNCYSLATVYGNEKSLYGLAGQFYQTTATMKNCYNANGPLTSYSSPNYSTVYKFYNSYETVTSGINTAYPSRDTKTNVFLITDASKMQGKDVFTNENKMPYLALNTDGSANTAFTAVDGYPVLTLWAPEPEIEEGETPEVTFDTWDGETKTEPKDTNADGVYEITNGAELAYIITTHGGEGNKYVLTNDIYLNDITKINWATGDVAIGYTANHWYGNSNYFEGDIDGNGYTVHGMFITNPALNAKKWDVSGYGLVPRVLHGDVVNIKNLGVDHTYIHSDAGASAFVGCGGTKNSKPEVFAEITIENCYAGKDVTLIGNSVGVFRGAGRGSNTYIRNCYSLATVDATDDYGLASMAWDAPITIEGCFNANGPLSTATATVKNSYQTAAGKLSTVTPVANMQGSDVLTNASKMPLLDSTAFSAATKDFSQHDFYVYLPIGTTFAEEVNAEYYNDLFIKFDTNSVVADGVMLKGAYVKFAAEPDESKIIVPAEYKEFVRYGSKQELILTNPWYGVKMDIITKNLANDKDSVKYAFITDIHYVGGEDVPRTVATMKQIKNLVEYVNKTDSIDFVAIGGDTIQGTQSKSTSLGYFKKAFTPFLNCNKPVVIIPGNHDDNSYAYNTKTFDGSYLISDKEWNDNIIDVYVNRETANGDVIDVSVKQDDAVENTKYFYYDLENKKTRIICLDSIDYEQTYDENGVLSVDADGNVGLAVRDESKPVTNYMRYYMATTYWGYGARQMEWLAEEALQAGDDWDYIFISHMGIDEDTNFNTGADITWYGKDLRNIIKAYQFKTPYVNEELGINVDFTNTNGEILSYQFGHTHRQDWLYSEDVDLWQVNSDTAQRRDGVVDIMTVNDTTINRYNIGRGFDQAFIQTKNVIAGDITNDGVINICDAVKLRNIEDGKAGLTTKADVDNDKTFDIVSDLSAILNILIS
ncbi:MAG: metallophosphoesterase [Clostridia bacterium]|nr:metallophosphoesterase [Clostridia bacterium]